MGGSVQTGRVNNHSAPAGKKPMEVVEELPASDHKPRDRRSSQRQRRTHQHHAAKAGHKTFVDGLLDRGARFFIHAARNLCRGQLYALGV